MKIEDAKKLHCLKCSLSSDLADKFCTGDKCMAWLPVDPNDLTEGVCMYLGLSTAFMKVLHLWSQMVQAPKSNIVGG